MDTNRIYSSGGGANPEPIHSESGSGTGFFAPMNLVKVILRRWWIVVLLVVVGGLGGFIHARNAPRIYLAQAELEMFVRRPKVINSDVVFDDSMAGDEDVIFTTRFKKFRSPAMEQLATHEYFKRYLEDENSQNGSIGRYTLSMLIREEVRWYKDPSANIVYVSYHSENPEFAVRVVNVLSHCAGLLMMQENQAVSDGAVKWLISQLDSQREELEALDLQLAGIRAELQLDSLEQRKAALDQGLIAVSGEREELVSTLASRKTVYDFVKELKGTDPNLEILPTGLPKEEQLNELIDSWHTANEELLLVAGHYAKIHPEYKKIAKIESRAKARLEEFIALSAKAVQNEIELLGKQLDQVDKRIKKMESESLQLELQLVQGMQRLHKLERKRDAADTTYQSILRRMEEARLSADENMAFTKIIRNAEVPRIPESAGRSKILFTSVFFGGIAGCGLVILLAFVMDKIESVSDLKSLGLNVLGTIPTQKKIESRGELATIGLRDKFNHLVEVFSGINALISSDKYAGRTQVMLMCSVMPGEGKTISACNLAISSAINGARTLLIDGDLRRPQLVNIFDIDEEHPSLLEWLSGDGAKLRHDQLVSAGIIENLDVITSRHLKGINPAELLGRGHLAELLNWAREHYDRVIIDSPPLGPVGDAQVFADQVDSIIVVSRIGKTRRRALKFALNRFREIDAHVLGCIANDVPHSLAGLFGGAEGYGYAHGYSGSYKSYGQDQD